SLEHVAGTGRLECIGRGTVDKPLQRGVSVTGTRRSIRDSRQPTAFRRGSVTLELIIMLPVWLIVMGAVVEFGLLIGNRQQVALASRVGAEEASRTAGLHLTSDGGPVPTNVVAKVTQQLLSSGIEPCKVTLEHNLAGGPPVALASSGCDCPTLGDSVTWPPESGSYVRVTVYVPATELTPNILKFFGFDLSDRVVRNATTFRHELP
ncbi:MAG: TadE/TadG family type IV pilus assembly protein, partial [Patescibacteria group bacterium]|nr:TadE/TadG family type IV pilus assembly protein [Patescibacteria group bacterium]